MASFNVENYFPVGKENDGHVITQAEYDERTEAIVRAIKDRLARLTWSPCRRSRCSPTAPTP